MSRPAVDVMVVLADLQQQLTDLTGVVEAQQRTLRHLLDRELTTTPIASAAGRSASPTVRPRRGT